jgi:hypothetical protein
LVVDEAAADPCGELHFLDRAARAWIARFGISLALPFGGFAPCSGTLLSFTDHLVLMLRFGPMDRFRESIEALKAGAQALSGGPSGRFVMWLRPTFSHDEANAAVKEAIVGTWLIRLSLIANAFTLHWRATECFPPLVCRVRYDGIAGEGGKHYAAVPENEGPQIAGSSKGFIVKRLGLRMEDVFRSPEYGRRVSRIRGGTEGMRGMDHRVL